MHRLNEDRSSLNEGRSSRDGALYKSVILSAAGRSRSECTAESKDPVPDRAKITGKGILTWNQVLGVYRSGYAERPAALRM